MESYRRVATNDQSEDIAESRDDDAQLSTRSRAERISHKLHACELITCNSNSLLLAPEQRQQ